MRFIIMLFFALSTLLLHAQTNNIELLFQKGHDKPIKVIAQSSDGKTLATGGDDLVIRLRDLTTGIEFQTFKSKYWSVLDEDAHIADLKFSSNNQYLMCFVRSDVADHVVTIRVKDAKVIYEVIKDGTNRNIAGGYITPDGNNLVHFMNPRQKQIRVYSLKSKKAWSIPYYDLTNDQYKTYTTEHWSSFKYSGYLTADKSKLLSTTVEFGVGKPKDYVKGHTAFVTDAKTGKALKRFIIPETAGLGLIIPDQDNKHFWIVPNKGVCEGNIHWQKYNMSSGQKVVAMDTTTLEYGGTIVSYSFTPQGYLVYDYNEKIYICKPGENKGRLIADGKSMKGNTNPDNLKYLGDISTLTCSADGKSVFVAYEGNNRGRKDDDGDVITIRQFDIATGRVIREFCSLGKMVNSLTFGPKGRALWIGETKSSHDKKGNSLLNIWKFREVGNLAVSRLGHDQLSSSLTFSPNRKQCFVNYQDFDGGGVVDVRKFSYSQLYRHRKRDTSGQQFFREDEKVKRVSYRESPAYINKMYSTALDEEMKLYAVEENSVSTGKYTGQIDLPKKKRSIYLTTFVHSEEHNAEVVVMEAGTIKDYEKVEKTNKLHFFNGQTGAKTATLDFGSMFWEYGDHIKLATNSTENLLAVAAEMEFKTRQESVSHIYIVDVASRKVQHKIPVIMEDCFDWTNSKYYKNIACAPILMSGLTFNPESTQVLAGWGDHSIKIWDIASKKLVKTLKGHQSVVSSISFHPKKPIMASGSKDGQILFWNTETWEVLGKMIMIDQNDYILYTEEGYYTATPKAMKWVAFKKGSKLLGFEQFDVKFNRPDKVMGALGFSSSSMIKMLKKAYDKRLKKLGFTEDMLGTDFHVPTLTLQKDIPFVADQSSFSFNVNINDTQEELNNLSVYVNDVPVYGLNGLAIKGKNLKQKVKFELSKGVNYITLSATNNKGAESLKQRIAVEYTPEKEELPDLYIYSVGVSNYQDTARDLTFASKDANDITAALKKHSKQYNQVHTKIITNENATVENVKALLDELKGTKVDDQVILYFSCHGLLDDNLDYYLAMHAVDFENPANGGLAYNDLEIAIADMPARKRLMFIDACHSGEVDKTEVEKEKVDASTDQNKDVKVRAKSGNYIIKPKTGLRNSFAYMQALFSDVTKGTGATIISAAGGMEYALESDEWGNGVFTHSILKGLSKKADLDENGYVKISELQTYVTYMVHKLTNGKQIPTARHVNRLNDFLIYKYK
ncbi:MAG: hypothetical protein GY810_09755 [Aureispira sp.]|nr:hypothetical protein [Aureispira sp.]